MTLHYAKEDTYESESAVFLRHGHYSAIVLPNIGGNLVSFRNEERGFSFLREPRGEEWPYFVHYPILHGIPVLFPPNRYDEGTFEFDGRTYRLPINESYTRNHLHGFAYDTPWEVDNFGSDEEMSFVTVKLRFDESHSSYVHFPHSFTLSQTISLSTDGLTQLFEAVNDGDREMPFMLGFHTTVNAPFAPGSTIDDIECKLAIVERWELDNRLLPTGRSLPLDEGELLLAAGKGNPYFASLDNHYRSDLSGSDGNVMRLHDRKANATLVYDAGDAYKHWMVYNAKANGRFFCPEPQTGMVNAPNVKLPAERTGLFGLKPGERWTSISRMYEE